MKRIDRDLEHYRDVTKAENCPIFLIRRIRKTLEAAQKWAEEKGADIATQCFFLNVYLDMRKLSRLIGRK